MRKPLLLLVISFTFLVGKSQTDSLFEGFDKINQDAFFTTSDKLKAIVENGELTVVSTGKTSWEDLRMNTVQFDMSKHTFISFKVKSNANVTVRFDLVEQRGNEILVSNAVPISKSIKGDGKWVYLYLDYTGHFDQAWPAPAKLNIQKLTGFAIILNPDTTFTGKVTFDSIAIGKAAVKPPKKTDKYININQIGYYPDAEKVAIVNGSNAKTFNVIEVKTNKVVLTDTLSSPKYWSYSDESVRKADFSRLKDTGVYKIEVAGLGFSHPFSIRENVLKSLSTSSVKAFYYQRCSYELKPEFAGIW